jgi:predicted MFS family arabinose efflux permease
MLQASINFYKKAYTGIPEPIWWLSLVMFINRSGTMVIPFLTVYLISNRYTLSQAGTVMSAFGLGAILGSFLGGRLSDRFGFFWVQFYSLLLNGVFFFILSYIQGFWPFICTIFLLAIVGEAFRPANAAAIAAYSNDNNRTRAYSLNRLAINLGWAIGPAVGGLLVHYFDYKWLFWADGFTCISAALLLYFFLFHYHKKVMDGQPYHKNGKVAANSAYKDVGFMHGMFCVLLIGMCFFQLFSMLPVYYKSEVHLSENIIGLILASNGIIIVLLEMVLVYKLEHKKHPLFYMTIGTFLIALSFLVLAFVPNLFLVVISMLMVTFGEMLLFPFTNSFWVSRTNNFNRGQYAAAYSMTFAIGQVLSPIIASEVVAKTDFSMLFIGDFILCSLAALGFLWLRKKEK